MNASDAHDAPVHVGEGLARRRIGDASPLKLHEVGDDLEAVLDAVVDLAREQILLFKQALLAGKSTDEFVLFGAELLDLPCMAQDHALGRLC